MTSSKNKKTGLLFGSFNPVHIGHLMIAQYMLQYTDIDEAWFVVSPHNPLKKQLSLLEDHHRLAMVNIAVDDNFRFRAIDIEFRMPRPSYTVETLAWLTEKYPGRDFVILAGSDILPTFNQWKNYESLLEYYQLYIYPRPGTGVHPYNDHPSVKFIEGAPLLEISAGFIRESIGKGLDMRYFLPEKVYDYIREMHFYE